MSIAASVTSHSCQVWGMSSPWHLSNLNYLKLSPPASHWLISPDTLHCPDRESLYPENNPALLPLHPKSLPGGLSVCLSFLDFTLPLPPYLFAPHYFPLWPPLSLVFPSVFVKLYSALRLSRSIFLLLVFSPPFLLPCWVCLATVVKNLLKDTMIADWGIACILLGTHLHSKTASNSTSC